MYNHKSILIPIEMWILQHRVAESKNIYEATITAIVSLSLFEYLLVLSFS